MIFSKIKIHHWNHTMEKLFIQFAVSVFLTLIATNEKANGADFPAFITGKLDAFWAEDSKPANIISGTYTLTRKKIADLAIPELDRMLNAGIIEDDIGIWLKQKFQAFGALDASLVEVYTGLNTAALRSAKTQKITLEIRNILATSPAASCKTLNQICGVNKQCCNNQNLACHNIPRPNPLPVACIENDLTCQTSSQCCSGLCDFGSKKCLFKTICVNPIPLNQPCDPKSSLCEVGGTCRKMSPDSTLGGGGIGWFLAFGGPARMENGTMKIRKDTNCQNIGASCSGDNQCCLGLCENSRCKNIQTNATGSTCTPDNNSCSNDNQCCSQFCQSGQCKIKYLCTNCIPQGKTLVPGKQCCPFLYPNMDNFCVPDFPPPNPSGHIKFRPKELKKKYFHQFAKNILLFIIGIDEAKADEPVPTSIPTPDRTAGRCVTFPTVYTLTQAEIFLNAFEFVSLGSNINDAWPGVSSSNAWNFNNRTRVLAQKYKDIRVVLMAQADIAVEALKQKCLELYSTSNGDDSAGLAFRAFQILVLEEMKFNMEAAYRKYISDLLPEFRLLANQAWLTDWDNIVWMPEPYSTDQCRDFFSYFWEEMVVPYAFGAIIYAGTMGAFGAMTYDEVVNLLKQKPKRECSVSTTDWYKEVDFGEFTENMHVGYCKHWDCLNWRVSPNTACNKRLPNSFCIKNVYSLNVMGQKIYLIDPLIPAGAESFTPITMPNLTGSYADRLEMVMYQDTTGLAAPTTAPSQTNVESIDLDAFNTDRPFYDKFSDLAKEYARAQGFFKDNVNPEVTAANLEGFASYSYNSHFLRRSYSTVAKYPPPHFNEYYNVAVTLLTELDLFSGPIGAIAAKIKMHQDEFNRIMNELRKNDMNGMNEGSSILVKLKKSYTGTSGTGVFFNGKYLSPQSFDSRSTNADPLDTVGDDTLTGGNSASGSFDQKLAMLKKNQKAVYKDWMEKVGNTERGKELLAAKESLMGAYAGGYHYSSYRKNRRGDGSNAQYTSNLNSDFANSNFDTLNSGEGDGSDQNKGKGQTNNQEDGSDKNKNAKGKTGEENTKGAANNKGNSYLKDLLNKLSQKGDRSEKGKNAGADSGVEDEATRARREQENMQRLMSQQSELSIHKKPDITLFELVSQAYIKYGLKRVLSAPAKK